MKNNILCTDLDGPIINCEDRYYAVYRDNVLEFGGVPISKDKYWEYKRNRVNEKELLKKSNVSEKYYDDYKVLKIARIEDRDYLHMDFLQSDTHDIMKNIRSIFQSIILITLRRNENALKEQLERLDVTKYFDYILAGFSEDIPAWKVKSDLFFSIFDGADPSRSSGYFIGDTEIDILAGKEIGLKTVAVTSGIRTREILEDYGPDMIVNDMNSFYTELRRN